MSFHCSDVPGEQNLGIPHSVPLRSVGNEATDTTTGQQASEHSPDEGFVPFWTGTFFSLTYFFLLDHLNQKLWLLRPRCFLVWLLFLFAFEDVRPCMVAGWTGH